MIVTVHVRPPIPMRGYDWLAYHDGYEETGPYGYGADKQSAIDDLRMQYARGGFASYKPTRPLWAPL